MVTKLREQLSSFPARLAIVATHDARGRGTLCLIATSRAAPQHSCWLLQHAGQALTPTLGDGTPALKTA